MTTPVPLELLGAGVTATAVAGAQARTILHPTQLRLEHRRVALIGSNGQGKTTVLRLLAGLIHPTQGSVRVDGMDWLEHGKTLRSSVGMLFADTGAQLIMPTVREDVELSFRPARLSRGERREAALRELDRLGISHLAERSVYELSGGERQLVALAGLQAVRPRLLLADEPTAALDIVNADKVSSALLHSPATLVVATHDLELAAECDVALWIHGGVVVAQGLPGDVIEQYVASAKGRAPWPEPSGKGAV